MIEKLTDKLVARSRRIEQSYVDSHARGRQLMWRDLLLFVVALFAIYWWSSKSSLGWPDILAVLVVGAFTGMGAMSGTRRALAFRSGWLAGRHRMVDALGEAGHRGISMTDWLHGEIERDFAMLGVKPPDDDRDDE